jgi:hypothetical protein
MVDAILLKTVPSLDVVETQIQTIATSIPRFDATFSTTTGKLGVKGFLRADMFPNDPYVTHAHESEVLIIINQTHPHWKQLKGSDGVLYCGTACMDRRMASEAQGGGIKSEHGQDPQGSLGPGVVKQVSEVVKNLLRSGSRVPAVLGILMCFNIHSGSCAPAERDLSSLATIFSQPLR